MAKRKSFRLRRKAGESIWQFAARAGITDAREVAALNRMTKGVRTGVFQINLNKIRREAQRGGAAFIAGTADISATGVEGGPTFGQLAAGTYVPPVEQPPASPSESGATVSGSQPQAQAAMEERAQAMQEKYFPTQTAMEKRAQEMQAGLYPPVAGSVAAAEERGRQLTAAALREQYATPAALSRAQQMQRVLIEGKSPSQTRETPAAVRQDFGVGNSFISRLMARGGLVPSDVPARTAEKQTGIYTPGIEHEEKRPQGTIWAARYTADAIEEAVRTGDRGILPNVITTDVAIELLGMWQNEYSSIQDWLSVEQGLGYDEVEPGVWIKREEAKYEAGGNAYGGGYNYYRGSNYSRGRSRSGKNYSAGGTGASGYGYAPGLVSWRIGFA